MFKVRKKSNLTLARTGILTTAHGKIQTPFFMPDATRGLIKLAGKDDLERLGLESMVVNTYHLLLQPGAAIIKKLGGINNFMSWPKPLLSDSGGYQVFSLVRQARAGSPLGKITDKAVIFKSPVDGATHELTPEKVIQIQFNLGVDMMVCLDDCPPNDSSHLELKKSVERTIHWARRCKIEYERIINKTKPAKRPLLFAVIQGADVAGLRKYCAEELFKIGFDGYGFGARPVDHKGKFLGNILKYTADLIPPDKLRFALGVGLPEDIVRCAAMGWDMFDCVIPTREGRHGRLFLWNNDAKKAKSFKLTANSYKTINITNARFKTDKRPINAKSKLPELREYSFAYLNYLFKINEPLGARLATLNNLEFYLDLMAIIRSKIKAGQF